MKIRNLKIKNFRGVKELDWSLPAGDIFCLIGKGDSSKSTILEAIRYAFYPQWNLTLSDSDFYQCNIENSIVIEVTIGNLVEEFCSLNKYGNYLRGWDAAALKLADEPDDHLESVLTVRLTLEKDLEPKWFAVCDRTPEGVPFKQADRSKVSVGLIPVYMWSDKLSLEERAFQDLPWDDVLASVKFAQDELGFSAHDQVRAKFREPLDKDISAWKERTELRTAIGIAANKSKWFKDITRGDLWFKAISPAFQNIAFGKTNLAIELSKLWAWAEHV